MPPESMWLDYAIRSPRKRPPSISRSVPRRVSLSERGVEENTAERDYQQLVMTHNISYEDLQTARDIGEGLGIFNAFNRYTDDDLSIFFQVMSHKDVRTFFREKAVVRCDHEVRRRDSGIYSISSNPSSAVLSQRNSWIMSTQNSSAESIHHSSTVVHPHHLSGTPHPNKLTSSETPDGMEIATRLIDEPSAEPPANLVTTKPSAGFDLGTPEFDLLPLEASQSLPEQVRSSTPLITTGVASAGTTMAASSFLYKCTHCAEEFQKRGSRDTHHQAKHDAVPAYRCPQCTSAKVYDSYATIRRHLKNDHKDTESDDFHYPIRHQARSPTLAMACGLCGEIFRRAQIISKHMHYRTRAPRRMPNSRNARAEEFRRDDEEDERNRAFIVFYYDHIQEKHNNNLDRWSRLKIAAAFLHEKELQPFLSIATLRTRVNQSKEAKMRDPTPWHRTLEKQVSNNKLWREIQKHLEFYALSGNEYDAKKTIELCLDLPGFDWAAHDDELSGILSGEHQRNALATSVVRVTAETTSHEFDSFHTHQTVVPAEPILSNAGTSFCDPNFRRLSDGHSLDALFQYGPNQIRVEPQSLFLNNLDDEI